MEQITSRQNSLMQLFARLSSKSSDRKKEGKYICEGFKLFEEALNSKVEICEIVITDISKGPGIPAGIRVAQVPEAVMKSISPVECPQGILFTVKLPAWDFELNSNGKYLLLDRLQDTGNVGTIIRSAEAFGFDAILYIKGTADPFGPKVVRASMGSIFRMPIKEVSLSDLSELTICVADMNGVNVSDIQWKNCVLAIGNEGQGLSSELFNAANLRVSIPMKGKTESLNASSAATILMWEMTK